MIPSRHLAFALKLLITGLLLFLVFRSVDLAQMRQDLARLEGGRLVILVIAGWLGQVLCAQRWRLFAAASEMRASFRSFIEMYFVGMVFNIGLPSLIGGDVIKAYMVSRKTNGSLHSGIASVLQDRAAGFIFLLALGSVAVVLHPARWRGLSLGLFYALIWLGFVVGALLIWSGDGFFQRRVTGRFGPLMQRATSWLADLHQALGTMPLPKSAILQVVLISLLNAVLSIGIFHQVSVAAGYRVDWVGFSALFPLIIVLTMLPISLGGIGIREWAYVEALALLHVPRDIALTIALTSSGLIIVTDLAGALFLPTIPMDLRMPASPEK